jgi:hypothetical protein
LQIKTWAILSLVRTGPTSRVTKLEIYGISMKRLIAQSKKEQQRMLHFILLE